MVERFGGEGPQRNLFGLRRLADGGEPAPDVAGVVGAVGGLEQRTAVIRSDRFSEGAIAEAIESGLVTAVLHRIAQLRRDQEP